MAGEASSRDAAKSEIDAPQPGCGPNELLIVGEPSLAILGFDSLARCLGIRTQLIPAEDLSRFIKAKLGGCDSYQGGIVVSVASLAMLNENEVCELVEMLEAFPAKVLFLATDAEVKTQRLLSQMTGGAVTQLVSCTAERVRMYCTVPVSLEPYTYKRHPGPAVTLAIQLEKASILMTLDDQPSFVRLDCRKHDRFVWSTPDVLHADLSIVLESEFESALDKYLPVINYMRHVYGEHCWHTPILGAAIVIDDPTVSRRYGCLDFDLLIASSRRLHYRVTVAFIPWNYWRVRSAGAKQFIEGKDCLSLCVHGCDHTRHEFESSDYADLLQRAQLATLRMMRLEGRTSLRTESVMVFPQEKFSAAAVRALADSRLFLGIVNTRVVPTAGSAGVKVRDLLAPAQDALYGIPIFKRHYFEGMPEFAMSLFLGRPAIMAAHHDDFREGPAKVERFVREISEVCKDLIWPSLGELIQQIHWRRRLPNNVLEIRFFTNKFVYDVRDDGVTHVHLSRNISLSGGVEEVQIDGVSVPFTEKDGCMIIETQHSGPGTRTVETSLTPVRRTKAVKKPLRYHWGVAFRRAASEFRDNVIARNSIGLSVTKAIARMLRAAH
jgi:hypothetical protein